MWPARSPTVTIFDLKTLAILNRVKVTGRNPDAIIYEPSTPVSAFNGGSATATALGATTGAVYTATADFGPTPAATAENPRRRPPMLPGSFVVLVVAP